MKKYINRLLLGLAVAIAVVSCEPKEFNDYSIDIQKITKDQVESLNAVITIDETNMVNFMIDNDKYLPSWYFPSTGARFYGNNITQKFNSEVGVYDVYVRIFNGAELSADSAKFTFEISSIYVPPYDFSGDYQMLTNGGSKTWMFARTEKGHLACGPSAADPASWWSAASEEKAGFGLYDDKLTFSSDKSYTYDPGEDGEIYVNKGCLSFLNVAAAPSEDVDVAVDAQNSTFNLEISDDQNTLYITFPANTLFGYLPDDAAYANPRLTVIELTASKLVAAVELNGIAWQYIFVPEEYADGGAPTIIGKWSMASEESAHVACGPGATDPTSWWAASANEKDGMDMYDDVLIFNADGTFTCEVGDGIYVNKGVTIFPTQNANEDYIVPVAEIEASALSSTYTLSNETLTFRENTVVSYLSANSEYENPTYQYTLTKDLLTLVYNGNGISWQYIYKRVE